VGVFNASEAEGFDVILPGLSYVEKSGTVINWQGKEQKFERALDPVGESKSIQEIFENWT